MFKSSNQGKIVIIVMVGIIIILLIPLIIYFQNQSPGLDVNQITIDVPTSFADLESETVEDYSETSDSYSPLLLSSDY